jgi:hypothetical protein
LKSSTALRSKKDLPAKTGFDTEDAESTEGTEKTKYD